MRSTVCLVAFVRWFVYFVKSPLPPFTKGGTRLLFSSPFDRGRIPLGCATMSGSFPAGPPREAVEGGKKGDFLAFRLEVRSLWLERTPSDFRLSASCRLLPDA